MIQRCPREAVSTTIEEAIMSMRTLLWSILVGLFIAGSVALVYFSVEIRFSESSPFILHAYFLAMGLCLGATSGLGVGMMLLGIGVGKPLDMASACDGRSKP